MAPGLHTWNFNPTIGMHEELRAIEMRALGLERANMGGSRIASSIGSSSELFHGQKAIVLSPSSS